MIYNDVINKLPPVIYAPRINLNSQKPLKAIQYDLILFGYRRQIGYYEIKRTCSGNIIIKRKLICFYDDEIINSVEKIHIFLLNEGFLDGMSDETIATISA